MDAISSPLTDIQALSKLLDEAQQNNPKKSSQNSNKSQASATPSSAFVPQKRVPDKSAIWTEEELKQSSIPSDDGREIPKYSFIYSQKVGAEDVFLGMDPIKNPHTMCSNEIVVEIELPKEDSSKNINLDITKQKLLLTSQIYYLLITLPSPVFEKKGDAKWDQKKKILRISLPLDPEGMFG